ncbi:MAG: F0F1 ATP synthase subunit B [Gaiellaceae bacterium]
MLGASSLISVTPGLMIWTIVCFLIVLYVLKRFAFGRVQQVIDQRRQTIEEAIEEATKARDEARQLVEEHRALIEQARVQAEEIRTEARRTNEALERRMREEVDADRRRRLDETRREIEAETERALERIRREVADLTLAATAKVTGKVLDSSDHRRLVEQAVADLDFSVLEESKS